APRGWKLYFKGGWGYGTGLLEHQVVLLTRGCARVSLAVLSMYDGSHAYGKATLRGMFERLLRGFPAGTPLYPVVLGGRYQGVLRDPSGHAIGTIDFTTTRDGQGLRRAVVNVDATSTCPGFRQVFAGSVAIDPNGRFAATSPRAVLATSLTLQGRFTPRRGATGALRARTAGVTRCTTTAGWVARAPS
ncbi:MAG TPA: hypothetical protein VLP43_10685, partial [Solirubrobacteraceae bacterium]|nr:hypothetical protein [Solirubrobacteraceae bacterium]